MGDFFNLVTPFFSTPTTYAQMLKKLAGLAFYEVFLITFLLRSIPEIDNALKSIESLIPHSTTYNLGGLAIALLVALLSHIIHLHDRISDALGIRRRFDRNHILIPLARLVGVRVTPRREEAMAQNRDRLMREVFYKYASSRAEHPLVDKHDIEHALGQWAWFWAFVEGAVFFAVGAVVAFVFKASRLGTWLMLIAFAFVVIAVALNFRLPRYARPEIEAIAADGNARRHVRATFDAL
jgi:hypothetical protein